VGEEVRGDQYFPRILRSLLKSPGVFLDPRIIFHFATAAPRDSRSLKKPTFVMSWEVHFGVHASKHLRSGTTLPFELMADFLMTGIKVPILYGQLHMVMLRGKAVQAL
jgi:hypothetical protein